MDNYKSAGVRILLADQFAPSTLCDSGEMCTVVLRYSNSTLADFTEYMLLPMVREGLNHTTGDNKGFTELVSQAMKEEIEIHLAILSGTSLLLDGAAGYTGGMTAIYELTQANEIKLGKSGMTRLESQLCYFHNQLSQPQSASIDP